jgi:hypothetical protein
MAAEISPGYSGSTDSIAGETSGRMKARFPHRQRKNLIGYWRVVISS